MPLRSGLYVIAAICLLIPSALAAAPAPQAHKHSKAFTVINLDTDGYSTLGTALAGYFRSGSLERIVARHYGETGKCIEEYTFTNGHLTFLLSTDYMYNGNYFLTRDLKVVGTTAARYYFSGDSIKRCLEGDKPVILTAERRQRAAECLIDARTFARQLEKQKSRLDDAQAVKSFRARAAAGAAGFDRDLIAIGRNHGVDYAATVRSALAHNAKATHMLFVFGDYTDAGPSESYGDDIGEVLRVVGDRYFAACLRAEPAGRRDSVLSDLDEDFPSSDWHGRYPETYALNKSK